MLDNLTYKQRNYLLLALFVVGSLVIYSLALKKTITTIVDCGNLQDTVELAANAPMRTAALTAQLRAIDNVLGSNQGEAIDFQALLLDEVSHYCQRNNLVLKEFPEPVAKEDNDYRVETNKVVVEGRFNKLLTLLYELEQEKQMGKVAGVQFSSYKERKTQQLKLTAAIYLQNVKKI